MQRPGFALALLLASLTSSILVVSKVNSQSLTTPNELPGPANLSRGELESLRIFVVLGQSVDAEGDGWADRTGGGDQFAGTYGRVPLETLLTTTELADRAPNVWWQLVRAGYDRAQDLVLNGRHYFAAESCPMEREQTPAASIDERDGSDVSYHTRGPTNLLSCEDYDHCFGEEFFEPIEPVLLPEGCAYYLWRGIEHSPAWMEGQMQDCWTVACEQAAQLRERIESEFARDEIVPVNAISPRPAVDFQEEVLLISAADSLDKIGSRLQGAAQYLRVLAADRIVTKWTSQRVARKQVD